jgi:hypothetical protein
VRADEVPLSGTLQLGVSSGWDGNVFYSSDTFGTVDDGFVEVAPRGVLTIGAGSGLTVGLDYAGAVRIYTSAANEGTLAHALDVPVRWWVSEAVRLELTAGVDHYYSPLFTTDHAAGTSSELAAAWSWGSGEVLLGYGAHLRFWLERDTDQLDLTHLPRVQVVQGIGSWLSLLAGYQLASRSSDQPGYDLLGHRALLGVAARVADPVIVRDYYLLYARTFESTGATELLHSNRVEVSRSSLEWMDVLARYDLAVNQAGSPDREFVAHGISVGLEVRWGARAGARDVQRDLDLRDLPPPAAALRPVRVGDLVRFRVRAEGAARVAVVGAFNEWREDAAPMALDPASGIWSADVAVPPGSWEFGYLVNGERVVVPEEADFYTESGFGDRNAVVVVEAQ